MQKAITTLSKDNNPKGEISFMLAYVLNKEGKPLMPTSPVKARILLKEGKAKVVKRTPFTIKLIHGSSGYKQKITLGVDSGSKTVGISATTETKELYSSEVVLRNNIVKLLSTRRALRKTRRNRLRYRKPRFLNRTSTKKDGWLAPSIKNKVSTHENIVKKVHEILPISKIIVEVASFDIQKIKNSEMGGTDYQKGEQLNFWNVREYVLFRDGHKCQGQKGCENKILNVHHIESRKTGGDSPGNLITLCEQCHKDYHSGKLDVKFKRGPSFRDAAFMGIMRWAFYNKLKAEYPDVSLTYGYITKNRRIENAFPKGHAVDAFCITGNVFAEQTQHCYFMKQTRKHNRQIHKQQMVKGSIKKMNRLPYKVLGFRLFDKVLYDGIECFIFGRRHRGYFELRTLDGIKIQASASAKKLELLETRKTLLIERRKAG